MNSNLDKQIRLARDNNKVLDAQMFANGVHFGQVRKYTNEPYFWHLAEVAGITASVLPDPVSISVAWLHDTIEDCGVTKQTLIEYFGQEVADGVEWLTDVEKGNRAIRKALAMGRMSRAPGWVQTIKCADLISNCSSIFRHDPNFAKVFFHEKQALLQVMTEADRGLWAIAMNQTPKE